MNQPMNHLVNFKFHQSQITSIMQKRIFKKSKEKRKWINLLIMVLFLNTSHFGYGQLLTHKFSYVNNGGDYYKYGGQTYRTMMDKDASGNIFRVLGFSGSIVTELGTFTSLGNRDWIIEKRSSTGTLLWVKKFGSVGNDEPTSMKVGADGGVVVGGWFSGTFDADPNAGSSPLNSTSFSQDDFVLKINSAGNLSWARTYLSGLEITDVAINSSNEVFVIGTSQKTGWTVGASTFNNNAACTMKYGFIVKINSAGTILQSKQLTRPSCVPVWFQSITLDPSGNLILTGYRGAAVNYDLNGGSVLSAATVSDFIVKYSSTFVYQWSGDVPTPASAPMDCNVKCAADGTIYMVKSDLFRKYSSAGTLISSFNLNSISILTT